MANNNWFNNALSSAFGMGGASSTDSLTGDPQLDAALASLDSNPAGTLGATTGPVVGTDLASMLAGTIYDISGIAPGLAAEAPSLLPHWAADLPATVKKSSDFNPYLGVVSQQGDELVYMGQGKEPKAASTHAGPALSGFGPDGEPLKTSSLSGTPESTKPRDKVTTVANALNIPYSWSQSELQAAMDRMKAAGFNVSNVDDVAKVWATMVQRSSLTYSATNGDRKLTPWDALGLYASENKAAASGSGSTAQPYTNTSRSVYDLSPEDAHYTLEQTVSQLLGRTPTEGEIHDFINAAQTAARKNPTVTRTHVVPNVDSSGSATGGATTSTVTNKGYDEQAMALQAEDAAKAAPDYASYQAVSQYFPALVRMLGATAG